MALKKQKTAADSLAVRVDEIKQAALLQHTKAEMKELQLSLFDVAPWSDDQRAMPNVFARSALFTIRNKTAPRAVRQGAVIFHAGKDSALTYTGIELRAEDDELVWQQVMEYAKRAPLGEAVSFTLYELCTDVGWSINGRYYKKAEECLLRLKATAITATSERLGRLEAVSMIRDFQMVGRGTKASRCQVVIDEKIVVVFAGQHYSKFQWAKYLELSPTARRMFDYFATHREPFPLKLEAFRLVCGSDSERTKKWREQTNKACQEMSDSGLVKAAWVHEDSIYCER